MSTPLWKVLTSLAALVSAGAAGFVIVLAMAWTTPGTSEERAAAIDTVVMIGFLGVTLIFSSLAIWQIWLGKMFVGLAISLGAWAASIVYVANANWIVDLFYRGD